MGSAEGRATERPFHPETEGHAPAAHAGQRVVTFYDVPYSSGFRLNGRMCFQVYGGTLY